MDGLNRLVDTILKAIDERQAKKTKGYPTQAQVIRVADGIAWVSIPGGVPETPVLKTIACKKGDTVQINIEGGKATITGNQTAPPTDDTAANKAQETADRAEVIAEEAMEDAEGTSQYFWYMNGSSSEAGAHVTEIPAIDFRKKPSGGNILMRSNSIKIRNAQTVLAEFDTDGMRVYENGDIVARFEADGAAIGAVGEQRALVNQSGFSILDSQDTEQFSVKAQGRTITDTKEANMVAQSNGLPSKRTCAMASGTSITVTLTAYNSSHVQTYSQTWNTTATAQTFQVNRPNINLVCAGTSNSGVEFRLWSTSQSDSYVRVKIEWVDTYLVPLISTIGDCDISGLTTASNVHNAITGEPANYVYLASGGTYYSVPLQESIKIGNGDLEIDDDDNTHVTCYKSGTIMVSGQVQFYDVNDTNILNARITVGGTVVAQSSTRARGNRCSLFITPRLANVSIVSPGTAIAVTLQVVNSSESGGYVASSNSSTPQVADIDRAKNYLTVQYV